MQLSKNPPDLAASIQQNPAIKKVALDCLDLAAVKGYPSLLISNIIFYTSLSSDSWHLSFVCCSYALPICKHRRAMILPFMTAFIRRLQFFAGAIFPILQRLGVLLRSLDSPFLYLKHSKYRSRKQEGFYTESPRKIYALLRK